MNILVVDDEKEIADVVELYLQNDQYKVFKFYNGQDALDCINSTKIDLAILDIMLPDIDAFQILKQIRQKYTFPVIMLTAKTEYMDKITGLTLGADDYMTKPFSPSELVARVKAHMERYNRLVGSNVHKNDVIEIRGIKIDKTARRVWVNGDETTFTTKEFDLLTFLAEHPNHVFSKEELFRAVWGQNCDDTLKVVANTVSNLRKKLAGCGSFIRTTHGGYAFVSQKENDPA